MTPEVLDVAHDYMSALDCPRSVGVSILLRYGEGDQVAQLSVNPLHYDTPARYYAAACATDFLRKFDALDTTIDLEKVTFDKWLWAERQCYITNQRLGHFIDRGDLTCSPASEIGIAEFILRARKKVIDLIGIAPPTTFDGAFGPGATVSDASTHVTVCDKMSSVPTLTSSAIFHLFPWMGTQWGKACAALGRGWSIVRGDIYFHVPKDSKSHRACGKGPSLNVFYQLGLGRVMRRRLRKSRLDLELGQKIHGQVARAGSQTGDFCTIDLSSASDCVSKALVKLLMPHRWYDSLNDLRSPMTQVNGTWYLNEKFSAMGNGYTFELETTLFAALILALDDTLKPGVNMWVYGDDIIVPREFGAAVLSTLKFFGFTPNERKTFIDGPFRESCGSDYFLGEPVRAHFLKEEPHEPQDYIALANGLKRVIAQKTLGPSTNRKLLKCWFRVLDRIPSQIRSCRGPEWLGDLVITDDEPRWATRWRGQLRYVRVYRPTSFPEVRFDGFAYEVMYAAALYGVVLHSSKSRTRTPSGDRRVFHTRGEVGGYKVGWSNCP